MNYNTTEVVYIHPVYNVCETVKAKVNLNRSSRSGYLSSLTSQNFSPPETTTKINFFLKKKERRKEKLTKNSSRR